MHHRAACQSGINFENINTEISAYKLCQTILNPNQFSHMSEPKFSLNLNRMLVLFKYFVPIKCRFNPSRTQKAIADNLDSPHAQPQAQRPSKVGEKTWQRE